MPFCHYAHTIAAEEFRQALLFEMDQGRISMQAGHLNTSNYTLEWLMEKAFLIGIQTSMKLIEERWRESHYNKEWIEGVVRQILTGRSTPEGVEQAIKDTAAKELPIGICLYGEPMFISSPGSLRATFTLGDGDMAPPIRIDVEVKTS